MEEIEFFTSLFFNRRWNRSTSLWGMLVFCESWRNHVVNCEEMKLGKILGLNVKLKNDESNSSSMMTVMWEEKVLKCDKHEVKSLR